MKQLLEKYIRGDASLVEKRLIIEWLDEDQENMKEYEAYRKLYTCLLWNTGTKKGKVNKTYSVRRVLTGTMRVAAILIMGFIGGRMVFNQGQVSYKMQELTVPVGQRAELVLSDGTKVWLNSRSTLKFPDRFAGSSRNVELEGEGYFTVNHDPDLPFIVDAGEYDIRVLGTEFNVKAYRREGLFETSLLEGSVEVLGPGLGSGRSLLPGTMIVKENGELISKPIPDYNYFRWRDGVYCFENESLASLVGKLQLYYDVTIRIEAGSLPDYQFSGKFRISDGIEHALKVLQLKHKFTYTRNDEQNIILIR